ncbi:pyridoxal phosphate-dependent transferase [Lentinula guzmanii]|uniref:cysteine-S-conjugate beta-lyase n=1 Tax=Lentinula guzmanii TaxID=2804957 RepID=A0AA38J2N0_9AGAR|nr:pyridoxal phosphate-dependent transferase [Lentinula guzmanii]
MAPTIDTKATAVHHDLPTPDPETPIRPRQPYKLSMLCVTDQYGSSSVPIYQSATFKGVGNEYDYSRTGNPTRSHLEHHIAKISSARCFFVSSGMAALDIIAGDDLYGGTNRLLTFIRTHVGVTVYRVDTTNPNAVIPFIHPTQDCYEIKERAPNAIDNTMVSPYLQRPLEHGADIVYDSATKYLSGHHDLMAGMITCDKDDLAKQTAFTINSVGNALTPIDCFLLLRGVKTMAVHMDLHYPGREIHQRISDGNGAVLSFETGDQELSEKIVGSTRLWGISVSFGCVNSWINMPCVMSHASIDLATRAARGLPSVCVKYIRVPPAHAVLNKGVEQLAIGGSNSKGVDQEWSVSAPGKVILFGEHAVVHGVTAIAASVDLRCYGLANPRNDGKLSARFNDIDNFQAEWDIESLPWDASAPLGQTERHPEDLDTQLIEAIQSGPLKELGSDKSQAHNAALAFLCMYIKLMNTHRVSVHFAVRTTLPLLRSCYCSCYSQRITIPSIPPPIPADHPHLSHHGRHALERHNAEEANRWAFTAEKILHGNPSGIDNSVAVFGGALTYGRPGFGKTSGMESIQGFGLLRFLLTNSKVPRDTKKLVAGVGLMKQEQPEVVGPILEAIENISAQAKRSLADSSEFRRDSLLRDISAMIIENHKHLVSLGNLSTKLTGAGGDFSEALMKDLLSELVECDFDPYLTSVGGGGMGILSPYPEHSNTSSKVLLPGQVTPPEICTLDRPVDSMP